MKEGTTPDSRNTPSTTDLEEEEIVDALGNDGNVSMPELFQRPNQWRKMMMMMIQIVPQTQYLSTQHIIVQTNFFMIVSARVRTHVSAIMSVIVCAIRLPALCNELFALLGCPVFRDQTVHCLIFKDGADILFIHQQMHFY